MYFLVSSHITKQYCLAKLIAAFYIAAIPQDIDPNIAVVAYKKTHTRDGILSLNGMNKFFAEASLEACTLYSFASAEDYLCLGVHVRPILLGIIEKGYPELLRLAFSNKTDVFVRDNLPHSFAYYVRTAQSKGKNELVREMIDLFNIGDMEHDLQIRLLNVCQSKGVQIESIRTLIRKTNCTLDELLLLLDASYISSDMIHRLSAEGKQRLTRSCYLSRSVEDTRRLISLGFLAKAEVLTLAYREDILELLFTHNLVDTSKFELVNFINAGRVDCIQLLDRHMKLVSRDTELSAALMLENAEVLEIVLRTLNKDVPVS